MISRVLGVLFFLAFSTSLVHSQMGPSVETSLDAAILNSENVALSTLQEYKLSEEGNRVTEVTVSVDDNLKGTLPTNLKIPTGIGARSLPHWYEGKSRFLIFGRQGSYQTFNLSDPDLAFMRWDFKVVNDAKNILRACRDIIRAYPNVTQVKTVELLVPLRTPEKRSLEYSMGPYLVVPITPQMEKWAIKAAKSQDGIRRREAAMILGYFNTPASIAGLKSMLDDSSVATRQNPNEGLGKGSRIYSVRQTAFNSLKNLGVEVKEPLITEEFFDPNAVTYIYLERDPKAAAKISNAAQFKNLARAYLGQTTLSVADLEPLTKLTNLIELHLQFANIDDSALEAIGRMKSLKLLNICGTKITSAGLAKLTGLSSLETLNVGTTMVDDSAIPTLTKFKSLKELYLTSTKVTPEGIKALKPMAGLRLLYLSPLDWQTGDQHMLALQSAGLLHTLPSALGKREKRAEKDSEVFHLGLASGELTNEGIKPFLAFTNLQELSLGSRSTNDETLNHVAKFKHLTRLMLNDTKITDVGLQNISGMTTLTELALANTQITDQGLKSLSKLDRITWLVVAGTKITDAGIATIAANQRALKSLVIHQTAVTDVGLRSLLSLPLLETIYLWKTKVTDDGILELAKMPSLKRLNARDSGVTHEGLIKFRRLRPDVEID